jgi:hypothetical protein
MKTCCGDKWYEKMIKGETTGHTGYDSDRCGAKRKREE